MKEKTLYLLKIFIIVFVCLCILAVVTLPEIYKQYTYDQAEILIVQEKYEEALANLKKIESKNIKDTKSLINLCEAHIAYSENDLAMAWFKLSDISFHYQTNVQKEKIEAFKETVNEKFNKYIAEETKKEKKVEIEEKETKNEQKSTYIPSKKKKIDSNDDPYNAKDYSDEEDFYDDYYDDFYDFEEAEEYYNEHTD